MIKKESWTETDRGKGERGSVMKKTLIKRTGLACPVLSETNGSGSVSIYSMMCLLVYLFPSCSPASNA